MYPVPMWPEWNDNDVSNEKWESDVVLATPSKGKGKESTLALSTVRFLL